MHEHENNIKEVTVEDFQGGTTVGVIYRKGDVVVRMATKVNRDLTTSTTYFVSGQDREFYSVESVMKYINGLANILNETK